MALATAASGSVRLRLSPRLMPRLMPVSSTEATAMADMLPMPTAATAMLPPTPTAATGPTAPTPMVDTAPTDMALATAASGSVRLRLSPRLRLMPVSSTEATAMADMPPMPTAASAMPTTAMLPPTPTAATGPTAPTPMVDTAPTDTASATAASGSVRLRLSPRLMPRLMPVFSTEAMAMADMLPMPT